MEFQYVFTKDEYDAMQKKHHKRLLSLCVYMTSNHPVHFWGNKEARIWGCCLHGTGPDYGYCDECLVIKHCPEKNKRYSK